MPRRPEALTYAVDDVPPLGTTLFLALQQVALMGIYLVVVIVAREAGASPEVSRSVVSLGLIAMASPPGCRHSARGRSVRGTWRRP